jgi:YfiH family protein
VVFTGRKGGVSEGPFASLNLADHVGDESAAVMANRDLAARSVGLSGSDLAVMRAAHGNDWALVSQPGPVESVDILVTTSVGVGLLALAADCVPLALVDPVAPVAAAVHSGWRGVVVDAAGTAVAAMVESGAVPYRIQASLGPAICPACYEVSAEVRDEVTAAASAAFATTLQATPSVAMHAAVIQQLQRAGVRDIEVDPTCTAQSPDLFSYRRDSVTGRQGVLVTLPRAA